MKVLIWIGCMIVGGFIMTFIPNLSPLLKTLIFAGECALATYLCKKWNRYKEAKKENERKNKD
ncbi:MAG: hypothetical protein IJ514_07025 [Clostridia bacterium]|nr:hypothetical protein [Clostridia bacterium]